ncbi:serine hydrolase domain-containing protein [Acetobacterium malicum]|uniref:serine hydrolase domain-containing protein n=1 Tax=Acetobacterium malicum TaxID=52692 RepID=UPI0035939FA8
MNKKLMALGASLVLIMVILSGCTQSVEPKSYEKTIETARTEIWNSISAGGASSATVAIMDNGNLVYEEGFAMANRETGLPVTKDTQFNICSVSKVFTAAAILQLCEDGKLELDKPVVDYLPEFTMADSRYKDITVRMLLNHTAALPGTYTNNAETTVPDPNYTKNFLAYLTETELKGEPGKVSVYCNDCFTLAQILVEKSSGLSFADYLATNIFNKAGMKNSSCYFKADNPDIARKYNEDGTVAPVEYINSLGSGGISSTAADLCRYGQALFQGKIINEAMFTEYTSPQYGDETVPAGTPLYPYGLGWDSVAVADFERQGVTVIGKNGGSPQYNSQLYLLPEENISVAIVFAGNADVTGVANDIVQSLLDENGLGEVSEIAVAEPIATTIPDAILAYAGIYGDGSAIQKIEFNNEKNAMIYKKFNGQVFETQGTYPYLSDGYFHLPVGYRAGFAENFGQKLFVIYDLNSDAGFVSGQKMASGDGVLDTSQFNGKSWIPTNLSAIDANAMAVQTGVVAELSGYIYHTANGGYTLYGLKDATTTQMVLPYGRDLAEATITESNGQAILTIMDYQLIDTAAVALLQKDEPLVIGSDGLNVCRKLDHDGVFSAVIPEGSRIVIYDPDLQPGYDSMTDTAKETAVTAGSYLVFIGAPGDTFAYNYTV